MEKERDIISQVELAKLIDRSRQYINILSQKANPPFSITLISNQIKIVKDAKTNEFINKYIS